MAEDVASITDGQILHHTFEGRQGIRLFPEKALHGLILWYGRLRAPMSCDLPQLRLNK
ncbi:hypothetical protein [Nocardiopsis kunsanensis]|uniref:hypothetical protein n=1 Tax=Nocardiopsis kunsanensis TaxID=141693 RepID=UPI0019553B75|nr:hypothetical protein [Nocardiopsis kunsanensis]